MCGGDAAFLSNYFDLLLLLLLDRIARTTYVEMRSIVANRVAWSVCHKLMIPAKTAEPIEVPFGLRTREGQGKSCIRLGSRSPWEWAISRGGATHCKV